VRKLLVGSLLLFLGLKYGYGFLVSDKFQVYGDRTKAPWTCHVNNALGELDILLSRYKPAQEVFEKTVARCPDTSMAEDAAYKVARCLEGQGRMGEAMQAFLNFVEKYPNSKRARIAQRAAQIIKAS
jgi:hypothetical protein